MKPLLPIVAVILLLGAVAAFVQGVRVSGTAAPPGEPWTPPERTETVNRCADSGFAQLRWEGGNPETWSPRDLVEQHSRGSVPAGRHRGEAGIRLRELLPDAAAVELVPCVGEPIRFSRSDLQAGQGVWLVPNQRGAMKALDFREDGQGRLITRAVHALGPITD